MTCLQNTNTITLHARDLDIDTKSVAVISGGGKIMPVTDVLFAPKKEFMYVKSSENFELGEEYVLTTIFMGNISNNLSGYYKSSYVDKETNQTRFVYIFINNSKIS